jgi:hypothetical protein
LFYLLLSLGTFTCVFKDKKVIQEVTKQQKPRFFFILGLLMEESGSRSVQIITDPDLGPEGPKKYVSGSGSGSGTLVKTLENTK